MPHNRRLFLCQLLSVFTCAIYFPVFAALPAPQFLLAQQFKSGVDVTQYLISEKYDGVRAMWDGKQFYSRQGNIINAMNLLNNRPRKCLGWLTPNEVFFNLQSVALRS